MISFPKFRQNTDRLICLWASAPLILTCLSAATPALAQVGALTPKNPKAQICQLPGDIAGTVTLSDRCVYSSPVKIQRSDTVLDCQGAVFTGFSDRAITIASGLQNVVVRNCRFERTGGILIQGPDLSSPSEDRDAARSRSSQNIVLQNLTITGSTMTGVFFDHFVVGATLEASLIERTTTAGVYLEFGSQRNIIRGNIIRDNGHETSGGLPRLALTRREGLAVDASAFNLIENNRFSGNAVGGIFLYKNCQEFHSSEPDQLPRSQHAHSNVISNNVFQDMPLGIWIAARQSRDLATWDCGDASPYDNPVALSQVQKNRPKSPSDELLAHRFNMEFVTGLFTPKDKAVGSPFRNAVSIWPDFAERTQVIGNRFERLKTGVRIEDDQSIIQENVFVGDFEYLYLGSAFRSQILGRPVNGTRIVGNSYLSKRRNAFERNSTFIEGEHTNTSYVPGGLACTAPWGRVIADGRSVFAYLRSQDEQSCQRETRQCSAGTLSGSYNLPACLR